MGISAAPNKVTCIFALWMATVLPFGLSGPAKAQTEIQRQECKIETTTCRSLCGARRSSLMCDRLIRQCQTECGLFGIVAPVQNPPIPNNDGSGKDRGVGGSVDQGGDRSRELNPLGAQVSPISVIAAQIVNGLVNSAGDLLVDGVNTPQLPSVIGATAVSLRELGTVVPTSGTHVLYFRKSTLAEGARWEFLKSARISQNTAVIVGNDIDRAIIVEIEQNDVALLGHARESREFAEALARRAYFEVASILGLAAKPKEILLHHRQRFRLGREFYQTFNVCIAVPANARSHYALREPTIGWIEVSVGREFIEPNWPIVETMSKPVVSREYAQELLQSPNYVEFRRHFQPIYESSMEAFRREIEELRAQGRIPQGLESYPSVLADPSGILRLERPTLASFLLRNAASDEVCGKVSLWPKLRIPENTEIEVMITATAYLLPRPWFPLSRRGSRQASD